MADKETYKKVFSKVLKKSSITLSYLYRLMPPDVMPSVQHLREEVVDMSREFMVKSIFTDAIDILLDKLIEKKTYFLAYNKGMYIAFYIQYRPFHKNSRNSIDSETLIKMNFQRPMVVTEFGYPEKKKWVRECSIDTKRYRALLEEGKKKTYFEPFYRTYTGHFRLTKGISRDEIYEELLKKYPPLKKDEFFKLLDFYFSEMIFCLHKMGRDFLVYSAKKDMQMFVRLRNTPAEWKNYNWAIKRTFAKTQQIRYSKMFRKRPESYE